MDIYISYARKADVTIIEHLLEAVEDEGYGIIQSRPEDKGDPPGFSPEKLSKASIKYDEKDLSCGCSIEAFMKEIAASRHLILVISNEYLQSPYCMYECLNAFNQIENAFYPSIVFIKNNLKRGAEGTLLDFQEGTPHISTARLKQYWESKNANDSDWYPRYGDMAEELAAWLCGRYLFGHPDALLAPFDPDSDGDQSESIQHYLKRALNPIECRYRCGSSDRLREQSVTTIDNLLKRDKDLRDALQLQTRLSIREVLVDKSAATFVKERLAKTVEQEAAKLTTAQELKRLRENSDRLFGELVKYGLQIETLYHQLRELDQGGGRQAYSVSPASLLPEMVRSRLFNDRAAFRKVMTSKEQYRYIGEREHIVTSDNILEPKEVKEDAEKRLSDTFLKQVLALTEAKYDPSGKQLPGQEIDDMELARELALDALQSNQNGRFMIKIEGFSSREEAEKMVSELQKNSVLKNIPFFLAGDNSQNCIKMHPEWWRAIDSYYQARSVIGENHREQ